MSNIYNKSSLSMWLQYLEQLDKRVILNLDEIKLVARKLYILNMQSFIFTVGGTNGKGTTCTMLEKLFLNSGYRVGLYTSPHMFSYLERVRINGNVLDEIDHISAFIEVEKARNTLLLSYFEFITLSALVIFKRYQLDIIILEVGLGGRLDATNIIDSNISIITNIGIEHSSILGSDRFSIAREKSGIFREGKIAIIGEVDIPNSINQVAKENSTILKKINIDWCFTKNNLDWNFIHPSIKIYNLSIPKIPLSSAATALSALYYSGFNIDINIIRQSMLTVRLPGRFHIISTFPYIILDVAHNPDAAMYLFHQIKNIHIRGRIYAIVGMFNDKDIAGIVYPLKNRIHYWYAAPLKSTRTATVQQLKKYLPQHNSIFFKNIHDAWKKVKKIVKLEDLVLVFGSFLAVSEFFLAKKMEDKNCIQHKNKINF